ncbi:thioredoxin domain-containing protein [Alkalibacterium indicireducens]|uniref:DsbA family protein n=1 Tax=Alkalibacterium indicireducens TaxID=398758 RepID=A0ABN1AMI3_9LACT
MDTSKINADSVTVNGGLHLGSREAPIKVVEFLNLKCPYCKEWWEKGTPVLDKYVEDGKVERIVKLFDKEKPGLRKGNILHAHINYEDKETARKDIDYYFENLQDWGGLGEDEVAEYAKSKRGAEEQNNSAHSKAVIEEAAKANVTLVPTVFIEDYIFDEHITEEELKSIIESKLKRDEDREPNEY